jgi:hypothetical protein
MRILLLHNRIHRAFPELDPFTEERCLSFLHAAAGSVIRRALHGLVSFLVGVVVLIGGMFGTAWAVHTLSGGRGNLDWTAEVLPFLLPLCAAPVAGFLARDFLLRRRVRWVLRTRGACPVCRYSLVGLPVGIKNTVTCPECALEVEVDPSLGELVLDEAGLKRFKPSRAALPRPPRIFTPGRVRFLKRAAIITAIILGIGLPALWGGYELWLRRQASIARAERPGAEALTALIESVQPAGSEGAPNAWDLLQEADAIRVAADLADEQQNPITEPGMYAYAEFSAIYNPSPPHPDLSSARQYELSEAKARRLLEAYRAARLFEVLDRAAAAQRAEEPVMVAEGEPLFTASNANLGSARHLARMNAARMELAREQGDLQEYIAALESALSLVRVTDHEPFLISSLVSAAIEALVYQRLHVLLWSRPDPEWLDAVDGAIARQSARPPSGYRWEAERLGALDSIAWTFADPARVRWGRLPSDVQDQLYVQTDFWVRTYASNRDALNEYSRVTAELAAMPRWQRPPGAGQAEIPASAPLAAHFAVARGQVLRSLDQRPLIQAGYVIASALERHRAATGAYPETLDSLAPSFLPEIPPDPWSGKPWGYLLRAPDAHPADPRGFILYSVGEDGQDDGGTPHKGVNQSSLNPNVGLGTDYIVNEWRPPEK